MLILPVEQYGYKYYFSHYLYEVGYYTVNSQNIYPIRICEILTPNTKQCCQKMA